MPGGFVRETEVRRRTGFGWFVAGILLTLVVLFVSFTVYLHHGHVPVSVNDKPFPDEAEIVHIPLNARIARDLQQPPFSPTHADLLKGAQIYAGRCAFCHGTPGFDSTIGPNEYPTAPQLWKHHGTHGVVGVSDDETGETYWKVKNGIRLTGMPSFERDLSPDDMWRVSMLVKQADKPLDADVAAALAGAPPAK